MGGITDCGTSFTSCWPDGDGVWHCANSTERCTVPSQPKFEEFWKVVDANEDYVMTRAELREAAENNRFHFVDVNPLGAGTIAGAFGFMLDVFGQPGDQIAKPSLEKLLMERRFP